MSSHPRPQASRTTSSSISLILVARNPPLCAGDDDAPPVLAGGAKTPFFVTRRASEWWRRRRMDLRGGWAQPAEPQIAAISGPTGDNGSFSFWPRALINAVKLASPQWKVEDAEKDSLEGGGGDCFFCVVGGKTMNSNCFSFFFSFLPSRLKARENNCIWGMNPLPFGVLFAFAD